MIDLCEWLCATYHQPFLDALLTPLAHAWLLYRTHQSRTGKESGPDMALESLVAQLDATPDLDAILRLHKPGG